MGFLSTHEDRYRDHMENEAQLEFLEVMQVMMNFFLDHVERGSIPPKSQEKLIKYQDTLKYEISMYQTEVRKGRETFMLNEE